MARYLATEFDNLDPGALNAVVVSAIADDAVSGPSFGLRFGLGRFAVNRDLIVRLRTVVEADTVSVKPVRELRKGSQNDVR